jgi:hypothetical protein
MNITRIPTVKERKNINKDLFHTSFKLQKRFLFWIFVFVFFTTFCALKQNFTGWLPVTIILGIVSLFHIIRFICYNKGFTFARNMPYGIADCVVTNIEDSNINRMFATVWLDGELKEIPLKTSYSLKVLRKYRNSIRNKPATLVYYDEDHSYVVFKETN